ncbi:MAG: hypothetical protein WCJ11_12240 [Methylococcaceae bacterium]
MNAQLAYDENAPTLETIPAPFSFHDISIVSDLAEMKAKMLADVFVLDGIALLGQLTVIYAKPNAGKTLTTIHMLKESIKAGRITGEKVCYVNADDSGNGLLAKGHIAEKYGFAMLAPGYKGFESDQLVGYLKRIMAEGTTSGQIVVLDTLKKFTDLMHKTKASEFMKVAREFTLKGGTVIMLAHANKNRGADGKIVAGGTSDIGDDGDCVYLLDEVSKTATTKTVIFENAKRRGNNVQEASFSYALSSENYEGLLDSVQSLDAETIEQTRKEVVTHAKLEKDKHAIEAITDAINQGNHKRIELIKFANESWGVPRRKLNDILDEYTGTKLSNSSLWRLQTGDKSAKIYYLLSTDVSTADDYENAKNGD